MMRKRTVLIGMALLVLTAGMAAYYKNNGAERAPVWVTATVTRGAVVDSVEVTVIDVPNPDLKLKPGMTANVTIEIARADNVLRVRGGDRHLLRLLPRAEGGGARSHRRVAFE